MRSVIFIVTLALVAAFECRGENVEGNVLFRVIRTKSDSKSDLSDFKVFVRARVPIKEAMIQVLTHYQPSGSSFVEAFHGGIGEKEILGVRFSLSDGLIGHTYIVVFSKAKDGESGDSIEYSLTDLLSAEAKKPNNPVPAPTPTAVTPPISQGARQS
jgi:hypothetical protein